MEARQESGRVNQYMTRSDCGQCHVRQSEIRKVKGTTRLDPKGCKIVGAGYTLHCNTVLSVPVVVI